MPRQIGYLPDGRQTLLWPAAPETPPWIVEPQGSARGGTTNR